MYRAQYGKKEMTGKTPEEQMSEWGNELLERMQTPEAEAAVDRFFNASPDELHALIRKAAFNGTLKAAIDEAVGDDPDLEV